MALYVPEAFPQGAKDLLGRLSEMMQSSGLTFTDEDIILAGCALAANVIAQSTSTAEQRQAGIASATRVLESVIDDVVGIARAIAEERLGRPLTAQDLEGGIDRPGKAPD